MGRKVQGDGTTAAVKVKTLFGFLLYLIAFFTCFFWTGVTRVLDPVAFK